jgi:hypothetical protein
MCWPDSKLRQFVVNSIVVWPMLWLSMFANHHRRSLNHPFMGSLVLPSRSSGGTVLRQVSQVRCRSIAIAKMAMPRHIGVVSKIEALLEELKALPPAKLEEAAGYIHRLRVASAQDRRKALEETFGCMTAQEAEVMEQAIAVNCERIDASTW